MLSRPLPRLKLQRNLMLFQGADDVLANVLTLRDVRLDAVDLGLVGYECGGGWHSGDCALLFISEKRRPCDMRDGAEQKDGHTQEYKSRLGITTQLNGN